MSSVAEQPTPQDPQPTLGEAVRIHNAKLSPRRRKEALLPKITRLALEGCSGRTIGLKLRLSKRTVNHWLQKLRREWVAKAAQDGREMCAVDLERLDAIYREAMEAWRGSQADMEVRVVEQSEGGSDEPRKKKSIRTQSQRRNAALLTRATAAVTASWRLKGCPEPPRTPAKKKQTQDDQTQDDPQPIPKLESPARDKLWLSFIIGEDLHHMTFADLREVVWRLRIVLQANGRALPAELTNQDFEHMTADELRAFRARMNDELLAIDYAENLSRAPESSPPDPPSNQGVDAPSDSVGPI